MTPEMDALLAQVASHADAVAHFYDRLTDEHGFDDETAVALTVAWLTGENR